MPRTNRRLRVAQDHGSVLFATECDRESPLYLEWDGFVSVMESWTNVMKSDSELRDLLVSSSSLTVLFLYDVI